MTTVFLHDNAPHRIIGRTKADEDAAFGEARYNVLQRRHPLALGLGSHWVDVREERVPDHVVISLGCLGDTGGWTSSLPQPPRANA